MPFKKGDPNINRKGRPRRQRCIPDILRKIGKERIEVAEGGKGKRLSKIEALMRMVYREGVRGNQWAVNFIADRTEGRPIQTVQGGEEPIIVENKGTVDIEKLPLSVRIAIMKQLQKEERSEERAYAASDENEGDEDEDEDDTDDEDA